MKWFLLCNCSPHATTPTAIKLRLPYVPLLVRGIQRSRHGARFLDPADKPRDVVWGRAVTLLLLLASLAAPVHAWNSQGHQLIAQIALMQLTPQEIKRLNNVNRAYQIGYQPTSLRNAAAWLDWMRCEESWCQNYRYYHYIDYPYSVDGTPSQPPRAENALGALQHALTVLQDTQASAADKGLNLRVLMHVIGDLHQPLHAVSLYSQAFPEGDQGGNRFKLGRNRVAPQLHAYWDRGGGYLVPHQFGRHRTINYQKRGKRLLKQYPCAFQENPFDFTVWAQESYQLAKNKVYQLSPNQKPSPAYHKMVVQVTQKQLALAGCRLGRILKTL
jgi:hypothetical protein